MMRYFILFFILLPALSSAFQLDWSGYYRANVLYMRGQGTQADINKLSSFFNEQQLVLKPIAHVSDGVSVQSHFLLGGAGNQTEFKDSSRRKVVFNSSKPLNIRLIPTHFYATYSDEFLQVDIGRQPFGFGLNITYSDGLDPLSYVYDVRDALAVKIQYESFYLKPYAIVHNQDEFSGLGGAYAISGGYEADNMILEILYKSKNYAIRSNDSGTESNTDANTSPGNQDQKKAPMPKPLIEAQTFNGYVKYEEGPLSASAEWGMMESVNKSAGFAKLSWQTGFYRTSLNLTGGYISDGYDVNLNYDPTFTFWGYYYYMSGIEKRERIGPQNCYVLSPSVRADLTDRHRVSFYHTWISDQDALNFKNHELMVITAHKITEGFSWYNKFATVFRGVRPSDFGVKTEVVVSF